MAPFSQYGIAKFELFLINDVGWKTEIKEGAADEKKKQSSLVFLMLQPVLRIRIRIRRIHMLLGLPDPHPDQLVKDMDPDPSIIKQK